MTEKRGAVSRSKANASTDARGDKVFNGVDDRFRSGVAVLRAIGGGLRLAPTPTGESVSSEIVGKRLC